MNPIQVNMVKEINRKEAQPMLPNNQQQKSIQHYLINYTDAVIGNRKGGMNEISAYMNELR